MPRLRRDHGAYLSRHQQEILALFELRRDEAKLTFSRQFECGKVLPVMQGYSADSFHGCLCDPPYGISFMGKEWDHGVPSSVVWAEVLRVLKPGAFLLAFGGTRTYHRLTCAIEDAGFEIRDCLMWLYGSGFPKSLDISKAIDKAAGAKREVVGTKIRGDVEAAKLSGHTMAAAHANRNNKAIFGYGVETLTAPCTDAAKLWNGYGTALKPAWEPCVVAMKPIDGNFAENALKHGVAGLNIDAGRIGTESVNTRHTRSDGNHRDRWDGNTSTGEVSSHLGRWPANLILDEEAGEMLDEQSMGKMHGAGAARIGSENPRNHELRSPSSFAFDRSTGDMHRFGDSGGASRFFYCPKVDTEERESWTNGNNHPTLKPKDLTKYLAKLMLPPGENRKLIVPYSGAGSEVIGACLAGWDEVTGIEQDAAYIEIAEQRCRRWLPDLFMMSSQ